nr:rho gtpase-activating protein 7 [Quercus suber]
MSAPVAAFERPRLGLNTVFKSGPLFISSKGIGWKSWKKRWFILTRTSLVFFKSDPSALPQRGGEVNLTLGGIDLNNSGSVVVREDKKLLTVLFPDGRDGRAFTLKAETSEDLYEWKTALEHALAQAPSAALIVNGIFRGDTNDSIDGSFNQWRDKRPVKSLVVGRPILLALEDIDGGPSFLEKALRFLEKYGTNVEGILRQSADVEEVDHRVQEYEQGKTEFAPDEDAHVVGDCVKHILRELPSSPVPASCCTALLEAYKIDRKEVRINAMRSAILETFPEPNRRLLQRFSRVALFSYLQKVGIGWKSWKKRWFILTRTSLVFFKSDPSALPQRGGEVNLTLGGIDLNNSGSVVVREDKKLLTVLFPDGRDGRAFTLKAETSEDLYEWKTALEHALAQAPSAALIVNGIFRGDTNDSIDGSFNQWRDKRPVKSLVVGRPILLALEDIDGGPSFLEKALRFLEKYGTNVEGILRQSADVEEVDHRVQEYEQGKTEFAPDEDAHVVGDCVKHILRELPSSPVPASCCTALLEAYKIDRKEVRINAMRSAILETFPEPNRRLLQRILKMMHTISSHAHENRMTPSAVAACMAPLLLRPLLAGECELEDDFDINGDSSAQLLAAANAANNAQAIITTLLEEYENIFDEENLNRCSISADSRIENSGTEDSTDDENLDLKDNGYHDAENEVDPETDDDPERVHSGKLSESSGSAGSDLYDYKAFGGDDSDVGSPSKKNHALVESSNLCVDHQQIRDPNGQLSEEQGKQKNVSDSSINEINTPSVSPAGESYRSMGEILSSMDTAHPLPMPAFESGAGKPVGKVTGSNVNAKRSSFWGRSNARKTPSMESVDSSGEEELAIQRLEIAKNDLQHRIAKEARGNAILQASLERRKQALHERRLALEQDVSRLQEQLQAERDLRAALEVGLSMSSGQFSSSRGMDSKTRAELEEIALAEADVARLKQKVAELHHQLNQQRQHHYGSLSDACDRYQNVQNHNSQQRFLQQDFDTTLAYCNQERKQRTERLEIAKNDLQHRIAKEARGNAILQASLERRKQALHERRLALEQDVSRLQEQLQAERDLRAALEVGLSMSSGQFSSSRGMDSKTRAELEEIALAEADVARLKQKVAELHHQLNQQRQHHYGSLSDACDRYQNVQNHNSQQRFLQQDFDTTLAYCNQERKQRTEESLLGTDWRSIKGQALAPGSSIKQPSRKQFIDSTSLSDSKSTEASTSMSMDELCAVDSASVPSTSRAAEVIEYPRHPSAASSTLVELTSRLDFFKERRSQLMEQLHNLDLNYGTTSSQDFVYRPSSPPWN